MDVGLWNKYGKAIIAFLFAVYTVVVPLFSGDHHIDPAEGIIVALAIGNNLLVYIVPLTKSFSGAKSVVNALMAGLVVAQTQIAGGIDAQDVMLIIGAVVAALGVVVAPAYSPKERVLVTTGSDEAVNA